MEWRRRVGVVAAAVVAVLLAAGGALADKEQLHLNARDMAQAKSIALRLADLGGASQGWSGGARQPDPPTSLDCGNGYSPKQSDLVVTGHAASGFSLQGVQITNQVEILKTERMVQLDWQRTVESAQLLPCLRRLFAARLPTSERFVSFDRITFPKVGTYTALYRAVIEVGSTAKTRVLVDFALVGVGRSEITLITSAPYVAVDAVVAAERRLAQTLVARATPGAA